MNPLRIAHADDALFGLALLLLLFTGVWALSIRLKDASIIDVFWGPAFAVLAWFYAWRGTSGTAIPNPGMDPSTWELTGRRLLVVLLVSLWAVRLGLHIFLRNRGHGEDPRYAAMRARHGDAFPTRSLFRVFWLQAALAWIIGMPFLAIAGSNRSQVPGIVDFMALAVFAIGFLFEAVGDWQLTRFKANPANRGRVLDSGLWRYTRHPNYFGDATLWWGYYLFAVAAGGAWTIFCPILMTFLIIKVSGAALLEKSLGKAKPKYADYVRRTPAFIPWFPKS